MMRHYGLCSKFISAWLKRNVKYSAPSVQPLLGGGVILHLLLTGGERDILSFAIKSQSDHGRVEFFCLVIHHSDVTTALSRRPDE